MPFLVFAEKKNDKKSLDFQGSVGIDLFNTCLENPGSSQPLQFVNFHQLEGGPKKPAKQPLPNKNGTNSYGFPGMFSGKLLGQKPNQTATAVKRKGRHSGRSLPLCFLYYSITRFISVSGSAILVFKRISTPLLSFQPVLYRHANIYIYQLLPLPGFLLLK